MATGGFKSNNTTDFLEEWKARREKMRAKMLGDIVAVTGAPVGAGNTNSGSGGSGGRHAAPAAGTDSTTGGNPERSASAGNCHPSSSSSSSPPPPSSSSSSYPVARSASGTALKRPEEEAHHHHHHLHHQHQQHQPLHHHQQQQQQQQQHQPPSYQPHNLPAAPSTAPVSNLKKAPPQTEKAPCASPDSSPMACNDSDKESPSPGKGKEKKSSGPSARKGKGQIEKRKLREKRRSTGVVNIPSNESLDELDDDDTGEKNRREEEELVQANTFQNESMTADPSTGHIMETPKSGIGRHKSSAGQGSEEEVGGNSRQRHNRHGRDGGAAPGGLEKRLEELEKELARERQDNARLLKAHQDKDDLIGKLKEEIDLLNRDLDDIEDENEQLKQENKTLLKVVGQLTR
ncbi:PRKC apoptosis WT1 regulator protein [Mugil cephalus]|uniref:PRKC apoptosis WT1 regulator protein n=1 Tax=Mugil cephalus TaxID=48193 RepID=UPI001FB652EC|nr:PRKC apoptosis WT1 regulator protein [Mugil cephalus]XP_047431080.1 PRKC apoptosis WT1 regulator protein [Mugil cephalus]